MKSSNIKNYIFTAFYLILISSTVAFGIYPYFTQLVNNQNEYNQTKISLEQNNKKYIQLKELSKNSQEIASIKKDVFQLIPEEPSTSDFIVKVEALAKELEIRNCINNISTIQSTTKKAAPKKDDKKNQKQEVEFSTTFVSSYDTTRAFLSKLYTFPRLVKIDNISLSGYNPADNTLNCKISGVIYYGQ